MAILIEVKHLPCESLRFS